MKTRDQLLCTCKHCQKQFRKRQASAKGAYCSRECHWAGRTIVVRQASVCPCGREFKRRGRSVGTYCSFQCKRIYQSIQELLNRDWLYGQYVILNRTSREIAESIGCDRKTVDDSLRRHGIPLRSRGSHPNCRRIRKGDPSPWAGRKHTPETRKRLSEIAKASGRKPYKEENGPPWKGKGGPGHPAWRGGITPERAAFYQTEEWKVAARTVWKRDGRCCQRCGRKKKKGDRCSFDIHHIVSFAYKPLRAEPSNLVLLCESCHYWIHSAANVDRLFIKDIPA